MVALSSDWDEHRGKARDLLARATGNCWCNSIPPECFGSGFADLTSRSYLLKN